MNRAVFVHAYAQQNLGDDLFVDMLCRRYPKTQFIISASRHHAKAWRDLENLAVRYPIRLVDGVMGRLGFPVRANSIYLKLVVRRCRAVVAIGGSIFMEESGWSGELPIWASMDAARHPLFVIGSNFGPYESEAFHSRWREVFRTARDVCFRDEASWSLFSALPNVRRAPDVVFGYSGQLSAVKEREMAVVSVIDLKRRPLLAQYEGQYNKWIADLCEEVVARGIEVALMGFCEAEGDFQAIRSIQAEWARRGHDPLLEFVYSGNIREALEFLNAAKYVVATRFHAMVLGFLFGKRVVPVSYSEKMDNVLDDLGFDGPRVRVAGTQNIEIAPLVDELILGPPMDVLLARRNASAQFLGLDSYLLR